MTYDFTAGGRENYAESIDRLGSEVGKRYKVLDDPTILNALAKCTEPLRQTRGVQTRDEFVARLVVIALYGQAT